MSTTNERQVALKTGGNFAGLKEYLDRRSVKRLPWSVTQALTFASAQHKLIPSTILSGTISVGKSSLNSNGYMAASLAGAVGTAATTNIADDFGNILNMVQIRDASTGLPLTQTNLEIFGLIQCSTGLTDGVTIGGAGSENLQISLCYVSLLGVVTLATAVSATIQFQANKLITMRNSLTIQMEGGNAPPAMAASDSDNIATRGFTVTTAFAANEVITLSTGSGASSGRSTPDLDTITLPASAALFNDARGLKVNRNGVQQRKGSGNDVVWDSTTSFHFTDILDVTEYIEVELIPAI